MERSRERYYVRLFIVAAVWNWAVTISLSLGYGVIFQFLGMSMPQYPVFLLLFLGLAFVFGVGYYWVSQDIRRNHGIVKMGIIGKGIVFFGITYAAIADSISLLFLGPGLVDLIFAGLFFEFLASSKSRANSRPG